MKALRKMKLKGQLSLNTQEVCLASLAHDLRTPMTCVQGAAQMALAAGRQGKDVSEQLNQILAAVHAMDRMLSSLCDAQSAGEACAFTADMLEGELLAMTQAQVKRRKQHLSINLNALDGLTLCADYAALTRVLTNLLGNASKYTQADGVITLRAELEQSHGAWREPLRLRLIVADNGMGMKPEFIRRMYVPFERAKESAHLPGRGLGLAIVSELVRRMNGTIRVKSEWGKGSAFIVTVPVRLVERTQKSPAAVGEAYMM